MIILAATPIGNLQDTSERLREALSKTSVIAAEDTRNTIQLMRLLNIENRPELISLNDHNEAQKSAELVERAKNTDVLVVSDAGMPTVSDPGYKLVQTAIGQGVRVSVIPGPSAVLTALAVSGLPTDRFVFEGFVPRGSKEKLQLVKYLQTERRTVVLFESAKRLAQTLEFFTERLGADRAAVVCRELTKMFEEVKRGTVAELSEWAAEGVKGEIVLLLGGASAKEETLEDALKRVALLTAAGMRLKDAAKEVARESSFSASELYEITIKNS